MKNIKLASVVLALTLFLSTSVNAVVVDYTSIADGIYSSISLGGTTVTGSSNVVSDDFFGFRGLGIQGGGSDVSLDLSESMFIDFGGLVSNATITLVDIHPIGNVDFSFEAFNGLSSLGVFSFPTATIAPETFDLYALSGNQLMTGINIILSDSPPLGLQIQGVSFTPIPVPAAVWLFGTGLLALVGYAKRKSA